MEGGGRGEKTYTICNNAIKKSIYKTYLHNTIFESRPDILPKYCVKINKTSGMQWVRNIVAKSSAVKLEAGTDLMKDTLYTGNIKKSMHSILLSYGSLGVPSRKIITKVIKRHS